MGYAIIETLTGDLKAWSRHDALPYNPSTESLIITDDVPPTDDARWNGSGWSPALPKSDQQKFTNEQTKLNKAVILWLAQKFSLPVDQVKAELISIYRTL